MAQSSCLDGQIVKHTPPEHEIHESFKPGLGGVFVCLFVCLFVFLFVFVFVFFGGGVVVFLWFVIVVIVSDNHVNVLQSTKNGSVQPPRWSSSKAYASRAGDTRGVQTRGVGKARGLLLLLFLLLLFLVFFVCLLLLLLLFLIIM